MDRLTEKTWVPVGLVASVIGVTIGATWWMSALFLRVDQAEARISSLESSQIQIITELQKMNLALTEIKVILKGHAPSDGK